MAIVDTGDVLPCIFSRQLILGNIKVSGSLEAIIAGKALQQVWSATKDKVMVCQDCEYRYVCRDCRPLSEAAAQGRADYLRAPFPRCTYNPYTGRWGEGIWSVDNGGQPYYDQLPRLAIQQALKEDDDQGVAV
jgi:radical SAM protein with 4Fe4S-binding SPASM domain